MLKPTLRVLLVEDNPGDARLLQETLSDIPGVNFHLTHVGSLADAVEAVGTGSFDIGLLDLGLPDAVGLDVVRRMHEIEPGLPLVVLTALNDERMAVESLQQGSQDYLVKANFDRQLLWRALRYSMERQRLQLEARNLSLIDDLTGLSNRKGFLTLASHQVRVASRSGRPFLVAFVDLDGMKHINDTFGHQEGNRALVETAGLLRDSFRQSDVIARLGGDEFAVLVTDASERSLTTVRNRVLEKVRLRNVQVDSRFSLSLSIGLVSSAGQAQPDIEAMLASADAEMYENKRLKAVTR
jgi:diguanylate cyclase (GGDEF)-like protein